MKSPTSSATLGSLLFALSSITTPSTAFSPAMHSSFLGHSLPSSSSSKLGTACTSWTMYDTSRDPPSSPEFNAWSVLANTEKWISKTLSNLGDQKNPYTRKEVSYDCDTSNEGPLLVAGLFRRLREVRELGEDHGIMQEEDRIEALRQTNDHKEWEPHTLRLTQVVVLPSHKQFAESFPLFDNLINTINQARRQARDYVTDKALEELDERQEGSDETTPQEWAVSVNCAHLHPKYGELTPQQELQQLKEQEEQGEVDLNYEEYKKKKMQARQSPYPSVVLEVRAMPPPDFQQAPPPPVASSSPEDSSTTSSSPQPGVTADDIQKLEALFGKTAHTEHPSHDLSPEQEEESFYNAIGKSIEQQLTALTPLNMAQHWAAEHDPNVIPTAAFTESSVAHVDAAYEYVFTNVAMMLHSQQQDAEFSSVNNTPRIDRHYLVLPRFLSSAATSMEKFAHQVKAIVECLPDVRDRVQVETIFHPEHVDRDKRSPVPMLVLQWKTTNEKDKEEEP